MKKKILLSLVLILLGSLTMTLCKVQAAEPADLETLQKLEVVTPDGEYKTGDTITFKSTFEKDIAGITTTGSLEISFSESNTDREIFKGTAINNTITYQYTIQEEDKGTLTLKMYSIRALTASNGSVKTDGFDNNVVIKANSVPTPTLEPEPSTTPDPEPSTTPDPGNIEDDFSNPSEAKFEVKYSTRNSQKLTITNVTLKDREQREYFVAITNSASEPDESELTYRTFKDGMDEWNFTKYAEEKGDCYYWVMEKYRDSNSQIHKSFIIKGKKIEKLPTPKYGDAFFATFISHNGTQIVFNGPNTQKRKFTIKIGQISDNSILNKIKNNSSDAFVKLEEYAKSNSAIYNENLETVSESQFAYESSSGQQAIQLNNLLDKQYYYMYVNFDDENGKFEPLSALTIAQASVYDEKWYMFFLGDDDFKWENFDGTNTPADNNGKDDTLAPDKIIPQTGEKSILTLVALSVMFVGGLLTYVGYRKNNYK